MRLYAGAVALAGGAILAVVANEAGADLGQPGLFLAITTLITLNQVFPLHILRMRETEALMLDEGFLVVMLLLASPFAAAVSLPLGTLVANVVLRRPLLKVSFNAGNAAVSAGMAVLAARAVAGSGAVDAVRILAALGGAIVFFWVNGVLVAAVIRLADRIPFSRALLENIRLNLLVWAGTVSVGVLVGLAGSTHPWALPFALVPAFTLYATFSGHLRARRDHERMTGLLLAATRVHALVGPAEVRMALGAAARDLLRSGSFRIGAEPPSEGELGAKLSAGLEHAEWLVVGAPRGVEPFSSSDQETLDALAVVGSSALSNAVLFEQVDRQRGELRDSMAKLQQAQAKYRSLVEQLPAVVYTADFGAAGRWHYVSPQIESILGFSPEEWMADAESWYRQLHPDDRDRVIAEEERSRESGEPQLSEYRLLTRDGRAIWFRDQASVLQEAAGGPPLLHGVLYDITQQKRVEEEVRKLNAELEERVTERTAQLEAANRAKTDFLSGMSHELRTPLNAIIGFGQLLEMELADPQHLDSVREMLKGGSHLLELVNELLDIARIESGRFALAIEEVAVNEALQDVLTLLAPLAAENHVTLQDLPSGAGVPPVLADRQRLKQVLLNLVSNAIKYNRPSGTVTVTYAEPGNARFEIGIRDEGRGIAAEDLDRLFTPFERLDAEGSEVEGTGLGLALSKLLVEAMGGTLEARSELGTGSSFFVHLPMAVSLIR